MKVKDAIITAVLFLLVALSVFDTPHIYWLTIAIFLVSVIVTRLIKNSILLLVCLLVVNTVPLFFEETRVFYLMVFVPVVLLLLVDVFVKTGKNDFTFISITLLIVSLIYATIKCINGFSNGFHFYEIFDKKVVMCVFLLFMSLYLLKKKKGKKHNSISSLAFYSVYLVLIVCTVIAEQSFVVSDIYMIFPACVFFLLHTDALAVFQTELQRLGKKLTSG